MRSIAIPVADRQECIIALDVTLNLAKSLGADVTGYHVKPSDEFPVEIDQGALWGANNRASYIWDVGNKAEINEAAANAKTLFDRVTQKHGYPITRKHGSPESPSAIFEIREGIPEKLFSSVGPLHDLIVVSRPSNHNGLKAHAMMVSALLDASTPVLILPQQKVKVATKNIVIAWNGGQAEAVLVHETLSLLKNANKVTFLTMGKQTGKGPTGEAMCSYLAAHDIKAQAKTIKGKSTAKNLEKAIDDEKADLLLCGAYTRGRMRELILGGVTEYLIHESNRPVLMLHV